MARLKLKAGLFLAFFLPGWVFSLVPAGSVPAVRARQRLLLGQTLARSPSTLLHARGSLRRDSGESKRQARVAQLIQEEVAEIIHSGAIKTWDPLGEDLRERISVVDVAMSADLRSARVFVSVFGDASAKREAFSWLVDHAGRVKHALAQRLKEMKRVPEVHFKQMDVCAAVDVMGLIDRLDDNQAQVVDDDDLPGGFIGGLDFDYTGEDDE